MSGAAFAWIERAGKDERKAEREARSLARKARALPPTLAELGHHVIVPRYRWPAAFAPLEADRSRSLSTLYSDQPNSVSRLEFQFRRPMPQPRPNSP